MHRDPGCWAAGCSNGLLQRTRARKRTHLVLDDSGAVDLVAPPLQDLDRKGLAGLAVCAGADDACGAARGWAR
jgi:hypothetical protein